MCIGIGRIGNWQLAHVTRSQNNTFDYMQAALDHRSTHVLTGQNIGNKHHTVALLWFVTHASLLIISKSICSAQHIKYVTL